MHYRKVVIADVYSVSIGRFRERILCFVFIYPCLKVFDFSLYISPNLIIERIAIQYTDQLSKLLMHSCKWASPVTTPAV